MLTPKDKVDKLKLAASLVKEVAESMDDSSSTCTCCGRLNFQSWTEHLMKKMLEAVASKLDHCRGELLAAKAPAETP